MSPDDAAPEGTAAPEGVMTAYRIVEWGRDPELVEVPVPTPGPGEVLVEVAGCGLCHSDLAMAAMPAEFGEALGWQVPFTLGHEVGGTIAALGPGAGTGWPPVGTPVAVASPRSCGTCWFCRTGRDGACPHGDVGRGYGRDGGLARYVIVDDARALVPLVGIDPRHAGPLTDAGATSHHAVRRALTVGDVDVAVVVGVGGLGSVVVQILKGAGVGTVIAVDTDAARRDAALALGADVALDGAADDLRPTIRALGAAGRGGVDAVIDVVGVDDTIRTGIAVLRRAGAFVLVGAGGGTLRRPWFATLPREVTVTAVQGSALEDLHAVVALAEAGRLTIAVEEFALADVAAAYAAMDAATLTGRAVVRPGP